MLIEESIHLRDSAQNILSEALGGKTLTRLERLVLISLTEAGNPQTVSQIGRNLGHSRQVVQRAANRLLELELVEKSPNPDHKASPLLAPTKKGLKFEQQMGDMLVSIVGGLLTERDIRMCRRVCRDLRKLREIIESHEAPGSTASPTDPVGGCRGSKEPRGSTSAR